MIFPGFCLADRLIYSSDIGEETAVKKAAIIIPWYSPIGYPSFFSITEQ